MAEIYYNKILTVKKRISKEASESAPILLELARINKFQQKKEGAKNYYRQGIDSLKTSQGPTYNGLKPFLLDLGDLYFYEGNYENAESLYRWLALVIETNNGPQRAELIPALERMAIIYSDLGRIEESKAVDERIEQIRVGIESQ
jgi:tetratricopeptide (TPR) repeat protein